jgi:hypothetical protein
LTNSDQFAEPPPRGWTLAEALSRLPEEELRDRLAPRKLRLRGFKWKGHSWAEGLEAVSTEADPLWAATAKFSLEFDMIYGDGLRLFKCRFLSGDVAAAVGTSIPARQASSRKSNKPLSDTTINATRALAAVLHREGIEPQPASPSRFAKRARELAEELDLPGWDALTPEGSLMRSLAQAMIEGVQAEPSRKKR